MDNRMEKLLHLKSIMDDVINDRPNQIQISELFKLNNYFYPQAKEHGIGCSGCRARVFNRMKNYLTQANEELNG